MASPCWCFVLDGGVSEIISHSSVYIRMLVKLPAPVYILECLKKLPFCSLSSFPVYVRMLGNFSSPMCILECMWNSRILYYTEPIADYYKGTLCTDSPKTIDILKCGILLIELEHLHYAIMHAYAFRGLILKICCNSGGYLYIIRPSMNPMYLLLLLQG